MIDPNKKYRCLNERWAAPTIYEYTECYVFGRAGLIPIAWNRSDGSIAYCPARYEDAAGLGLIEVKPEVTVRWYARISDGELYFATYDDGKLPSSRLLAPLDITHDGEKIIKVEIVNDYAPGAMR